MADPASRTEPRSSMMVAEAVRVPQRELAIRGGLCCRPVGNCGRGSTRRTRYVGLAARF